MKKILSIFLPGFVVAFALQSCNQPKVDTAKEMAKIDSMASARLMMYRDSMQMICMNDVMLLAQAKSDSMMQAAMKKGTKPKPIPPKPVTTDPKKDKMSGNTQATTQEKKDKMSGDTTSTTKKKKDKMKSTEEPPK